MIPSILYKLTLGKTTMGYLRSIDKRVRKAVRTWLHLPHECPNAYIHASIKCGGLGVPSMRWKAPFDRIQRLRKIMRSNFIEGDTSINYVRKEIHQSEERTKVDGVILDSPEKIDVMWSKVLYKSVDGVGQKHLKTPKTSTPGLESQLDSCRERTSWRHVK